MHVGATPPHSGQRFVRAAGVALPLFSLRGADDLGTGSILDLIPFIDWLDRWDQRVVQLLPLNEAGPVEASPYTTLSAFAIDPTFITTSQVADVAGSTAAQRWLRAPQVRRKLRTLRDAPRRDRPRVYAFKLRLLEFGFAEFEAATSRSARARRFEAFCERNARWLNDYALFRAVKERRRWASWETWPEELRRRDAATLAQTAAALRSRIRFAQYLQWIAAEQWETVRAHARQRQVLLKGDLPFVCGPDSADVWAHQELFDLNSSAGAPPDAFSATGQKWGLPLYNWTAMREAGYAWWRQRARQARELYDVFRIDHVIGLYRTFAIPVQKGGISGFTPHDEHTQWEQGRALLGAVLEEADGDAAVIAEDLGTVPDWVRDSLTQLDIPGYKVLRWEKQHDGYIDPRTYPPLSVATTGTHDTDTLAAWWEDLDMDERQTIVRSLDLAAAGLQAPDTATPWSVELHLALLRRLYESGSVLTILPIQDLFGWTERINTPATVDESNWTYRLPVPTHGLDDDATIRSRMEALRDLIDQTGRNTP